jgi:hypothetical protein
VAIVTIVSYEKGQSWWISLRRRIYAFHGRRIAIGGTWARNQEVLDEMAQAAAATYLESGGDEKKSLLAASNQLGFEARVRIGGGRRNQIRSIPLSDHTSVGLDDEHVPAFLGCYDHGSEHMERREEAAWAIKNQLGEEEQAVLGCIWARIYSRTRVVSTLRHLSIRSWAQVQEIQRRLTARPDEVKQALQYHARHRMTETAPYKSYTGREGGPSAFELHKRHWGRLGFCPACSTLPDAGMVYCCRRCSLIREPDGRKGRKSPRRKKGGYPCETFGELA